MDNNWLCQILSFIDDPKTHANINLTSEEQFYKDLSQLKDDGYLIPTSSKEITIDPKTQIQTINYELSEKGKKHLENKCKL